MNTVQGERVLLESSGKVLTLTSHRVRYEAKASGHSKVIGITLDAVASCGLVTRSYPVLLAIAGLAGIGGLVSRNGSSNGSLLFVAAVILVLAYFITRSAVIEVASAGERIRVSAKGMSRESLMEFIDNVEAAKLRFVTNTTANAGVAAA